MQDVLVDFPRNGNEDNFESAQASEVTARRHSEQVGDETVLLNVREHGPYLRGPLESLQYRPRTRGEPKPLVKLCRLETEARF